MQKAHRFAISVAVLAVAAITITFLDRPTSQPAEHQALSILDNTDSLSAVDRGPVLIKRLATSWPSEPANSRVRESLDAEAVQEIERSGIPVLLFSAPDALSNAAVNASADRYVANYSSDDLWLTVSGIAIEHTTGAKLSDFPLQDRIRGHPGLIIVYEGNVRVSWQEFGLYYDVTVGCREPLTDTRCTSTEFARTLAESLVFVGGKR